MRRRNGQTIASKGRTAALSRCLLASVAVASLLACLAFPGCGGVEEGHRQAEELRSRYAEMRSRMVSLEGFFLETEELLATERGERLKSGILRLVEEKRRLYSELVRELDELARKCSELAEGGGRFASYASSLEDLVRLNQEEAVTLAGALLTAEDLARLLPLEDPKELPPRARRISESAARVEELRSSLREGEERAEEQWRGL